MKIQDAIERIIKKTDVPVLESTLDTVKAGDAGSDLKGIACTFMASIDVLRRAVDIGANFVITHEPTFYSHLDERDWLADDPIYRAKKDFLEQNDLVVWRFHDYPHRCTPDQIAFGVLRELGLDEAAASSRYHMCEIPPQTLGDFCAFLKKGFGVRAVRVVGELDMMVSRVSVMPGAAGGRRQISALQNTDAQVVVCGESPEWETCEYIRDGHALGITKALVVVGHANSEEAGVKWLTEWIRSEIPGEIPVSYLQAGDPFSSV